MRKKIFSTVLSFIIYSTSFAQQNGTVQNTNMNIPGFEKLVINANVKVQLIESEHPFVELNGSPSFIRSFRIKNKNNEISINSSYYSQKETENTVTIGVKKLKHLLVMQDAQIVSANTLSSPVLNVLLDALVTINLKNSGKTNVETGEGFYLENM